MGQKTSPIGFRLGITHKHQSEWFVDPRSGSMKNSYPSLILEDKFIRDFITQKFLPSPIAQILIFRTFSPTIKIEIHADDAVKLFKRIDNSRFLNKKVMEKFLEFEIATSNQDTSKMTRLLEETEKLNEKYLYYQEDKKSSSFIEQENKASLDFLTTFPTNFYFSFLSKYEKSFVLAAEDPKLIKEFIKYRFYLKNLQQDLQIELLKYQKTLSFRFSYIDSYLSHPPSGIKANLSEKEILKTDPIIGLRVKQLYLSFRYASIFAKYLINLLERRITVKNALKYSLEFIRNYYLDGIKIKLSGRLDGVDMAEQTYVQRGRIPLSTLSAKIDYCCDTARTMYGIVGIKIWTYQKFGL